MLQVCYVSVSRSQQINKWFAVIQYGLFLNYVIFVKMRYWSGNCLLVRTQTRTWVNMFVCLFIIDPVGPMVGAYNIIDMKRIIFDISNAFGLTTSLLVSSTHAGKEVDPMTSSQVVLLGAHL